MGQYDRNQPVDGDDLKSDDWKLAAGRLAQAAHERHEAGRLGQVQRSWSSFPTASLWYLPFEVLQVPAAE